MPLYLNDKQAVLFLHIPKTAGTTIESWLENSGRYEQLLFSQEKLEDLMVTPQHLGYETLTRITHGVKRPLEYKFAIVRNPYDRLVSEFFYRLKLGKHRLGNKPEELFSPWLTHHLIKYKKNRSILDNHLRPQSFYTGEDVEVFKFEDGIQNIISNVGAKLGIKVDEEVKAKKVSARKEVIWSEAAVKLASEVYSDDFDKFDYSADSYPLDIEESKFKVVANSTRYIYRGIKRKLRG